MRMTWAERVAVFLGSLHVVAFLGMMFTWWIFAVGLVFAAAGLIVAEGAAFVLRRVFRTPHDETHLLLSLCLWVVVAWTVTMESMLPSPTVDPLVFVTAAIAFRIMPMDARPPAAAALVVGMVCQLTYVYGRALDEPVSALYFLLYAMTILEIGVFAIERSLDLYRRRRGQR